VDTDGEQSSDTGKLCEHVSHYGNQICKHVSFFDRHQRVRCVSASEMAQNFTIKNNITCDATGRHCWLPCETEHRKKILGAVSSECSCDSSDDINLTCEKSDDLYKLNCMTGAGFQNTKRSLYFCSDRSERSRRILGISCLRSHEYCRIDCNLAVTRMSPPLDKSLCACYDQAFFVRRSALSNGTRFGLSIMVLLPLIIFQLLV